MIFFAPFKPSEGIKRTLQGEFISPNLEREIFFTE